jgi:hypothetical protein
MSTVQIIKNDAVVNVIVVDPSAVVAHDGSKVTWPDGELDAPDGAMLMMQAGAGIGWTLANGALVAPPTPQPPPAVIPAFVSRRQFFQAAAQSGIITQAEALALFATGVLPSNLTAAIAALPVDHRFPAQIAILGSTAFERANPLIEALGAAMGQNQAQIDALFTLAATL